MNKIKCVYFYNMFSFGIIMFKNAIKVQRFSYPGGCAPSVFGSVLGIKPDNHEPVYHVFQHLHNTCLICISFDLVQVWVVIQRTPVHSEKWDNKMPFNTPPKRTPTFINITVIYWKRNKNIPSLHFLQIVYNYILGWKILAIKIRFQPTNKHSINLAIDHFNSKKI